MSEIELPPKGLGLPRIDMPQIKSTDMRDFIKFLKDERITVSNKTVSVSKLKLTQLEIDKKKVGEMLGVSSSSLDKPVLVSKDWFILDGHHRITALYNKDPKHRIRVIQVNLNIGSLLKTAKRYPKVMYKTVNEKSNFLSIGEYIQDLNEVLITFNRKAYPKFGQIVILMGGAGSGKGFVKDNLLGIDGKTFDVDALKGLAIKSKLISKRVKDETGHDLNDIDMKNSEDVSLLHNILGGIFKLDKRDKSRMYRSILTQPANRKPNLIFDVTLKDINKLHSLSKDVIGLGYDKKNIHIVWVLNKFDVSVEQNSTRDRVVSDEIMLVTHEGAALTMKKILDMGKDLQKYMDGDIHLAWNQVKVDNDVASSDKKTKSNVFKNSKARKGMYIKRSNYMTLKKTGKRQVDSSDLSDVILAKVRKYIPDTKTF